MDATIPFGRRERLAHWWGLRTPGERFGLALAAVALGLALLWVLVWNPLQRDSARLARRLVEERAALAEARLRADEIAGLARSAPAANAGDARAAIEAALARENLTPAAGAIEGVADNRWHLAFDAVAFEALTALLEHLQRDAGLRAAEVSVTARVEPGQVRADVTLTR
jgi:general secretion pathway protein M